jgi:hypothetical protein
MIDSRVQPASLILSRDDGPGSVGHCRANGFSRRSAYRLCLQGAKTCWRGKDQASTRESVRNAG